MNAQQEAVALFKYLESRGVKVSIRMVARIMRTEMRIRVDDKSLRDYLKKFTAVAPQSEAVAPQQIRTNTAVAPQSTAPAPRLRAHNNVSLVSKLDSETDVSSSPVPAKQLALVDATEERAREILGMFWPRVESAVGKTLTRTEWGKRNKRDALNFAAVARSDADLLAAHESASKRLGSCVYSLRVVADELLRGANPAKAANGSRASSQSAEPLYFFRPENGATDYAAAIRARQKKAEDAANK